jgi:thiamine-monophosphate kinase
LDFVPRVREALCLYELADLHALIDVSDGLAADLGHLCRESGCGAVLRAEAIPVTPQARQLSDGRTPLEHALADGEDFELVLAVAPADGLRLTTEQPVPHITLAHIGECIDQGLWLEAAGHMRPLDPRGYVHPLD